ncbi:hypothetical protein COCOBI_17-2270 [Coccomyxa sp. Obi]|nr:hypothetical protein COCOBI_17-2270 [Coccomyxa sp. Obi]
MSGNHPQQPLFSPSPHTVRAASYADVNSRGPQDLCQAGGGESEKRPGSGSAVTDSRGRGGNGGFTTHMQAPMQVWYPQQPQAGPWAAWQGYQPVYPWHASPPMMHPYPQYFGQPYAPPFRPPPRPPRPPGNPSKASRVKNDLSSRAAPFKPSEQGPQSKQQVPARDEQKSPPSGQKSSSSGQNNSQSSTTSSSASSWVRVVPVRYSTSSEGQTEPSTPQSVLSRSSTLPTTLNPAALPFYPTAAVAHGVPTPTEQRPTMSKPQSHALAPRRDGVRTWRPAAFPMSQFQAAPRMRADKQQQNSAQVADKSRSQLTEKPNSWKAEAEAVQADPLPTLRRIRTRKVQSSTMEPCSSEAKEKVTPKLDRQPASAPEEWPVSKVDEKAMSKSDGQPPTQRLLSKTIEAMTRPEKQPSTQEQPLSKSHQESITEASKQPPTPIEQQPIPKAERKARKLAKPIPLPPSPTETSPHVAHSHFKDAQPKESKSTHGAKVQQGRSGLQHAAQAQDKAPAGSVKPGAETRRPGTLSSYSGTPRPQPRQALIQPRLPGAFKQSTKVDTQFKSVQTKVNTSFETPSENEDWCFQKLQPDGLSQRALADSNSGSDSSLDILLNSPGANKPGSAPAAATAGLKVSGVGKTSAQKKGNGSQIRLSSTWQQPEKSMQAGAPLTTKPPRLLDPKATTAQRAQQEPEEPPEAVPVNPTAWQGRSQQ